MTFDREALKPFSKYIWWKTPDEAVAFPERLVAQVMNIGSWDDVCALVKLVGDDVLRDVIARAEIGWFNERSWYYWHYRLGLAEVDCVPPLPTRFKDQGENMSKEKIELFTDINEEFSNINIQLEELKGAIEYSRANRLTDTEKWVFETACASSIEKIYSGIERILIRIGNDGATGSVSHTELIDEAMLDSMAVDGVRPAVISHETLKILHELRLFSAKERDSYGFMVGSLNLAENAEKVIAIVPVVINEINFFKAELAMLELIPKREYIPMINKYEIDINTPDTIKLLLKAYSQGQITAGNAAWEIQQLNIDGFLNPSVSEVIIWSRNAGYGIPNPPDSEVAAQVEKAWKRFHPE